MLSKINFDENEYIVCDSNKVSLYNKLINDKKIFGSNNLNQDEKLNNNKCYYCKNKSESNEEICKNCIWEQHSDGMVAVFIEYENNEDINLNKDFDITINYINNLIDIENNLIKEYQYNIPFNFVKDILYIEKSLIDYSYCVKDIILMENNLKIIKSKIIDRKRVDREYNDFLYRKYNYKKIKKRRNKYRSEIDYLKSIFGDMVNEFDPSNDFKDKDILNSNKFKNGIIYNKNKENIKQSFQIPDDTDEFISYFGYKPSNICLYCYDLRNPEYKFTCKDCYIKFEYYLKKFNNYIKYKYNININNIKDNNKLLLLFKSFLKLNKIDYEPFVPIPKKDKKYNKYNIEMCDIPF